MFRTLEEIEASDLNGMDKLVARGELIDELGFVKWYACPILPLGMVGERIDGSRAFVPEAPDAPVRPVVLMHERKGTWDEEWAITLYRQQLRPATDPIGRLRALICQSAHPNT